MKRRELSPEEAAERESDPSGLTRYFFRHPWRAGIASGALLFVWMVASVAWPIAIAAGVAVMLFTGPVVAAWWTRATLAPFQAAAVPGEGPARLLAPRTGDLAPRRSVPGIGRAAVAHSRQLPQRTAADPAMKGRQARALTWDGWCLTRSSRMPFRSAVTSWGRPPRPRRCAASNRSDVTQQAALALTRR
jgi:hypothetical protein